MNKALSKSKQLIEQLKLTRPLNISLRLWFKKTKQTAGCIVGILADFTFCSRYFITSQNRP